MVYKINYSARAEKDAETAGYYYEKVAMGLSLRFFSDLDNTINSLSNNPSAFHYYKKDKNIRRANLDIFPFAVFFHLNRNTSIVVVIAIIHQKRSKAYFRRRLK
jgi:plasmid stabilization system protein ParE